MDYQGEIAPVNLAFDCLSFTYEVSATVYSQYTQLVPIVFKAPREFYIETLGVKKLTFFLNMCAKVYDKNCIMMSLFEYAKPFGFFSMYFLLAEVGEFLI